MAKKYLRVLVGKEKWRAKRHWTLGVHHVLRSEFTDEQVGILMAEPQFIVEETDMAPGGKEAESVANVADTNMKIAAMETAEEIDAFLKDSAETRKTVIDFAEKRKTVIDFAEKRKKELAG